jgi:ribosome-binding factor A
MTRFRKNRVSELILQAISDIIRLKIKDPRVQGITVTHVEMSADLKLAKMYFSTLTDGKVEDHKKGLEAAAGFIRHQLGRELDLKYVPELTFHYDTSFDNFSRINRILKDLGVPETEDVAKDR